MAWQDELRELDSALATGQISADDYRRRRDEVLSAAQSGPPQPEERGPFPPPFNWNATPANQGGQPGTDATQVVPNAGTRTPDAERTQHVRPVTAPDVDRTQVVPQSQRPPGPTSGGFPAQQFAQPNWSTGGDAAPPWGSGSADVWGGTQGPEVFEEKSSGAGRRIAIIAVVVVVLAGLGVGAYFLWGRDGANTAGGDTSTSQAPTTTTTPPKPKTVPDGPFVEVPGTVRQFKTLSIEEAVTAKVPTLEEAQLLQSVNVVDVRFAVSTDDSTALSKGIWAFNADDAGAAATVLEKLDELYQAAGFQLVSGSPDGVLVRHLPVTDVNKVATYRAHYLSDGFVVRVEAYSPNEATAGTAFEELLTRQLADFAPTK